MGVFHYVLQGGEPLADPRRLEPIVAMCHPDESYINLVSNGWLVTKKRVEWLRQLGVDKVTLSLDSGIEAHHDANRMQGSYRRVLAALDCVLESGLLAGLSTVVTHTSLYGEGFRRVYDLAREKGVRLHVQIAEPVGRWERIVDELLTPEDSDYLRQVIFASPELSNGRRLLHRDIYTGSSPHCPAGIEFLSVTVDGQVLPCNFLQFSLGSIRERSLTEMRGDLLRSEWFSGGCANCLAGENAEFISRYMRPATGLRKPLDAYLVFELLPGAGADA